MRSRRSLLPEAPVPTINGMNQADVSAITLYVSATAAHESAHMTVLFKAGRLLGLNYLPHETALDEVKGVVETDTPPLTKDDCVAFAASIVGELICLGNYDEARIRDDRKQVQQLSGQPIETFVREAYEIIQRNLLFFSLLTCEVRNKMLVVLLRANSLSLADSAKQPPKVPLMTLPEVEAVYQRAEALLSSFHL